jgi:hypothetical protein
LRFGAYCPIIGPIAYSDTISITSPNSVDIYPLKNDSDVDGDSLCIIFVTNSNHGIDSILNCSTIFYKPDSNFIGQDTIAYTVCDNGTPSLCKSGKVIVNVAACAWPTASLIKTCQSTITPNACDFFAKYAIFHSAVDSIKWHLTNINGGIPFDTIINHRDSIGITSWPTLQQYPNYVLVSLSSQFQVCCELYSSCGVRSICDTLRLAITDGINEINPSAVKLYPNPASGKLNIDLSALSSEDRTDITAIILYDALGQKVQSVSYQQQPVMHTDMAGLPSGIYTVCVSGASNARKTIGRIQVIH